MITAAYVFSATRFVCLVTRFVLTLYSEMAPYTANLTTRVFRICNSFGNVGHARSFETRREIKIKVNTSKTKRAVLSQYDGTPNTLHNKPGLTSDA